MAKSQGFPFDYFRIEDIFSSGVLSKEDFSQVLHIVNDQKSPNQFDGNK